MPSSFESRRPAPDGSRQPAPSGALRLRELPRAERPRERLKDLGAHALAASELLAILIGSGTPRRSALALAQANEVARTLAELGVDSETVPITTSGDRGANPGASPAGVKGLFVDEIVRALQEFDVDLAVHSAKDLPSEDPGGIVVAAVP
ncbi:MAG TPA: UPF0758 domain-containing protein, partial [Gemmatimonadaceae bacterium]